MSTVKVTITLPLFRFKRINENTYQITQPELLSYVYQVERIKPWDIINVKRMQQFGYAISRLYRNEKLDDYNSRITLEENYRHNYLQVVTSEFYDTATSHEEFLAEIDRRTLEWIGNHLHEKEKLEFLDSLR
jgi:hypothetical protein